MKKRVRMFKEYVIEGFKDLDISLSKKTTSKMLLNGVSPDDINQLIYSILESYTQSISVNLLTEKDIIFYKEEIKRPSKVLERYLSDEDYEELFNIFHDVIKEWIEEAVEAELYETAANINKLYESK